MISGKTRLIAHIGYPTESFKAPMIYNPWFEKKGIDAVVVPMGVKAEDYLAASGRVPQVHQHPRRADHHAAQGDDGGAGRRDHARRSGSPAPATRCCCKPDGTLAGDMFDGAGFVRGVMRKGPVLAGRRAWSSAPAASARRSRRRWRRRAWPRSTLFDTDAASAEGLAERLRAHYPTMEIRVGSKDPAGYDLVVNATPLGMKPGDPLPIDVSRLAPDTFVGEVVMKQEITPLPAGREGPRAAAYQVGTDMLFEMIPAYLEFFGFGTATPDELRAVAKIAY